MESVILGAVGKLEEVSLGQDLKKTVEVMLA